MAPRWRPKGKSETSDEAHKAETVVVLTSSDDEKANEDLSLAVIEKANQSKAKAKAKAKRKSVEGSLVNISSDEAELDKHEVDKTGGEESRKKKRPKKKKKERDAVESQTPQADKSEAEPTTAAPEVRNSFVGLTDAEPPGTKEPVLTDGNEAPDNKILRKLLRGARYFDPGETLLGMCFNCGEEGHMAANCLAEKKKKPCFRCGQFGHFGKDCTQGQYCYTCKKNGHKAKECPEKNKNASENSKVCLKCCEVGHDMFLCASNYPRDDMKEIQCYVCKKEGHLCCAVVSDSSAKVVSCYNCAELGHTGAGCAKPRRETGTVVTSILCYKCGGEGHFARGCSITNGSIVRSVLGITPKSKKSKVREREEKFGFRSAPEGKMGMKRKGTQYDKKGSTSSPPKSRRKGRMLDVRDDFPSSSSSKKFKPKIFGQKDRSFGNSGYERDYSTRYSSEKRHWQGHSSPRTNNQWNQHKPRYSESRYSNSHTRFSHTYE